MTRLSGYRTWRNFGLLLTVMFSVSAWGHTIRPAVVTVDVDAEGATRVAIRVNAETLVARIGPEYTDTDESPNAAEYNRLRAMAPAELATEFKAFAPAMLDRLELEVDGQRVLLSYEGIEIPDPGDLELSRDSTVQLSGKIPPNSASLVWRWPAEYGSNVLRLSTARSNETYSAWLKTGESSEVVTISDGVAPRSRGEIAANYVKIGFEHIVPKGVDHILFVVGIFLLSAHLRPLLWQVTAFTVAHTITLGMSIYGLIDVPAGIVEPLIALSIAYVGIENCLFATLKPWRVALVFMFGLLHGMGFAGVLTEIGLPPSEFLTALITFNVGVEFGQLTVIAGAFLLVGWWRDRDWYRARIVIPFSLVISVVGLYWTVERII
jgi:hydrogenase/urease accessory protein HupE